MLVTSTETLQTIRDGEPRTSTSSFTQLPSSDWAPCSFSLLLLCPRRPHVLKSRKLWSLLSFHFSVALHPQRLYGPLGTGSPGHPPRLSRSSWVPCSCSLLLYIHRDRTIRAEKPWTFTSTFTQLPSSKKHAAWGSYWPLSPPLWHHVTSLTKCFLSVYSVRHHGTTVLTMWETREWPLSLPLWHTTSLTKPFSSA